ncbi:MAG: alpha/beta hydrolase [Dehalococcoidia bacterium]
MSTTLPDFESGYANVNGTDLYYEIAGSGTPLILVHGLSLDKRIWDSQFGMLAENYRVIRYDARGHGKSVPTSTDAYSHSKDLKGLMDALSIDRAHLVGLSMGGRTVIDFTIDNPGRAISLVPVDSPLPGMDPVTDFPGRIGRIIATANESGMSAALDMWCADELFTPAVNNPISAEPLDEIVRGYSGWNWTSGATVIDRDRPAAQLLDTISAPTLVIVGELDLLDFHVAADAMEANITDARKSVISGAGHMSNMEDPATFNTLLKEFLSGIE